MPKKNENIDNTVMNEGDSRLELTFEQAAAELDAIVNKLSSGSVQLDEMIALFERGTKLSEHCNALLAEYDGRIARVMQEKDSGEQ